MNPKFVNARVNNVDVEFEADSGSDLNLFSRTYFQRYSNILQRKPKLNKCDKPIFAANNTAISSIGWFYATMSNPFASVKTRIYVMNQETEDAPLMSRNDLFRLGYLKIDPNGRFAAKKVTDGSEMSDEQFKQELAHFF